MKACFVANLLLVMFLLSGCSQVETPVWETVSDDNSIVVFYPDEIYTITFEIPEDTIKLEDDPGFNQTVYRHKDGEYEITTQVFLSAGMESAVRQLTGYDAEQLSIIETQRFGMPEYRFTWYRPGEETGALCRADLMMDGTVCYAVTFSADETVGGKYNAFMTEVFSTIGLFYDEGV